MGYWLKNTIECGECVVLHTGANNNLYTYNMNNVTLKTVDVERDLWVSITKNGKYSGQYLMATTSDIITKLYKSLVRP